MKRSAIYCTLVMVSCSGDEPICYRGPLCQLPLSIRAAQLFNHTMKPVNSRLLVSPECFAGHMKFFCGPHVRHPWFSVMVQAMDEKVFKNEGPLVDL